MKLKLGTGGKSMDYALFLTGALIALTSLKAGSGSGSNPGGGSSYSPKFQAGDVLDSPDGIRLLIYRYIPDTQMYEAQYLSTGVMSMFMASIIDVGWYKVGVGGGL